jgi:hypothetical protein
MSRLDDGACAKRFANDKGMPNVVVQRISGFTLNAHNGGNAGFEGLGGSGNGQREHRAANGCGIYVSHNCLLGTAASLITL